MQRTQPSRQWWLSALLFVPATFTVASCDIGIVGRECSLARPDACGAEEYCAFEPADACGAADQTGTCEPIPEACDGEYAPVCGCDDQTYPNACSAAAAGVSVASQGACEASPADVCGGIAGLACDAGEYCDYGPEARCEAADLQGVCTPLPEACDLIYQPVCSCDGQTFGNACDAARAGVSITTPGECNPSPDGDACGGLAGLACDDGEFCNYPPEASCGAADQTGVCTPIPEACTLEYSPVCGCDGNTYGNACAAASEGVSIVAHEACEDTGSETCGGLAGLACDDGEFCNYPPEATCGAADQTGVCTPRPQGCTKEYDPVCGCDDQTYGNACEAASAGVSVASRGECASTDPDVQACGSRGLDPCEDGEFCNFPASAQCGAADLPGECTPVPQACTAIFDPVCGCDDQTYGNACEAASAGVSVSREGACDQDLPTCGTIVGLTCAEDEYCDFGPEATCQAADLGGVCRPKPEVCPPVYEPVCSCDGEVFGSACDAAAAGISVTSACDSAATPCGGLAGLTCSENEICVYAPDDLCGAADAPGVCQPVPETCTEDDEAVCACGGTQYANVCEAAAEGVSLTGEGSC